MDWVLYYFMVVVYEKGGLLGYVRWFFEELKILGYVFWDIVINVMVLVGKVDEVVKLFWCVENVGEIKDILVY